MVDRIFKSDITSTVVLFLVMFSSLMYLFLPNQMDSTVDTELEIGFSIDAIVPFFLGIIVYTAASLLDVNISNKYSRLNPNGLRNPIFSALSMLPLCSIMVFLIIDGSEFAVAPGLGWVSAAVVHIFIYEQIIVIDSQK